MLFHFTQVIHVEFTLNTVSSLTNSGLKKIRVYINRRLFAYMIKKFLIGFNQSNHILQGPRHVACHH